MKKKPTYKNGLQSKCYKVTWVIHENYATANLCAQKIYRDREVWSKVMGHVGHNQMHYKCLIPPTDRMLYIVFHFLNTAAVAVDAAACFSQSCFFFKFSFFCFEACNTHFGGKWVVVESMGWPQYDQRGIFLALVADFPLSHIMCVCVSHCHFITLLCALRLAVLAFSVFSQLQKCVS